MTITVRNTFRVLQISTYFCPWFVAYRLTNNTPAEHKTKARFSAKRVHTNTMYRMYSEEKGVCV